VKTLYNNLVLKFLEYSLLKGSIILCGFLGITEATILIFLNKVINYEFCISISNFFGIIIFLLFLNVIIIYISKKLKSKQTFNNGTRVILKNDKLPDMVISKYNFWNNKVLCVWSVDREIKEKWFNQDVLREYKLVIPTARSSKTDRFKGYFSL